MSDLSVIDAVILAGGLGTRLQSAVADRPKPLAAIHGRAFLDILIDDLVRQGIRRLVLCVSHRRAQIISHFRGRTDAEFLYSEEETPLGTGGAVHHALSLIKSDPFLLLNGDSICTVDYQSFLAFHRSRQATVSMVVAESRGRTDGGNIELTADGQITAFREKTSDGAGRALINAGVYLMPRNFPATWRLPYPFSLERDVFPPVATSGGCYGYVVESEVLDIGTPERYTEAQRKL